MSSSAPERVRPGRGGILDAATRLFATHGVSGTSLQQIAGAAGITKAAVYHHFPTKEEVVAAVLAPALEAIDALVRTAEAHDEPRTRTEAAIIGLADQAVTHRQRWAVLLQDAAVEEYIRNDPGHDELFTRLRGLLTGPGPDPGTRLQVALFLSGLLGPAQDPSCADIDDDDLRAGIVRAGRLLLLDGAATG
ncbi:TetR/AcrR family transcriptional regulator [Nocardioides nitrophenolicus]|uniref:TetR/AcrR family transcriptional regulator n=1 Tax=Nocardioides nitrophenolicus TaxID=60489 RepID=UPI00195BD82A|nr:TetR/AcrR family transcriptional regulator [Nocardioides nitrophenolicus]MBM7517363.1 AcrR family transcriptional regulator [Nocardioides nitrophenolicus]